MPPTECCSIFFKLKLQLSAYDTGWALDSSNSPASLAPMELALICIKDWAYGAYEQAGSSTNRAQRGRFPPPPSTMRRAPLALGAWSASPIGSAHKATRKNQPLSHYRETKLFFSPIIPSVKKNSQFLFLEPFPPWCRGLGEALTGSLAVGADQSRACDVGARCQPSGGSQKTPEIGQIPHFAPPFALLELAPPASHPAPATPFGGMAFPAT